MATQAQKRVHYPPVPTSTHGPVDDHIGSWRVSSLQGRQESATTDNGQKAESNGTEVGPCPSLRGGHCGQRIMEGTSPMSRTSAENRGSSRSPSYQVATLIQMSRKDRSSYARLSQRNASSRCPSAA